MRRFLDLNMYLRIKIIWMISVLIWLPVWSLFWSSGYGYRYIWSCPKGWFYGPDVTLQDCLSLFFSEDELKGDNMYSCEKCKKLRNGLKFSEVKFSKLKNKINKQILNKSLTGHWAAGHAVHPSEAIPAWLRLQQQDQHQSGFSPSEARHVTMDTQRLCLSPGILGTIILHQAGWL